MGEACSILACLTAVMNNLSYVDIKKGSPMEKFIPHPDSTGLQEGLDLGNDEEMIEVHKEIE